MSKFNYKSSIITISCFKYLLTLFMDDIGVIDNYLSYPWLKDCYVVLFPAQQAIHTSKEYN